MLSLYLTIIIALLLSAFFSGMEIAFVSANKLRFEIKSEEDSLSQTIIRKFYKHPQQYITTILIGNNIVLVIFSIEMNAWLEPILQNLMPLTPASILSLIISVIATIIVLVVGEFFPKTIMRRNPYAWLRFFSPLLYLIYFILYPIAICCNALSRLFMRLAGHPIPTGEEALRYSTADLNFLVEESLEEELRAQETIKKTQTKTVITDNDTENNEMQLFKNALNFTAVRIRDCYVPRTEVTALPFDTPLETLVATFQETGYSKIPIFKGDIDNIVGYIHCAELFSHNDDWQKHLTEIPFVSEHMAASRLMQQFMQQKKSIAVVVDEFGGTAGIVTLEDIMEEIFGEIEDEHDKEDYICTATAENEYTVSGRLDVSEVNHRLHLDLPESEEYDTLAGLILHSLGAFPKQNEPFDIHNWHFKCLKIQDNRIELVKITR